MDAIYLFINISIHYLVELCCDSDVMCWNFFFAVTIRSCRGSSAWTVVENYIAV
jgi:hypothetical protein